MGARDNFGRIAVGWSEIIQTYITPAQVARYNAEGYHIFREQLFPQGKFNGLKSTFEGILDGLDTGVRRRHRPSRRDNHRCRRNSHDPKNPLHLHTHHHD